MKNNNCLDHPIAYAMLSRDLNKDNESMTSSDFGHELTAHKCNNWHTDTILTQHSAALLRLAVKLIQFDILYLQVHWGPSPACRACAAVPGHWPDLGRSHRLKASGLFPPSTQLSPRHHLQSQQPQSTITSETATKTREHNIQHSISCNRYATGFCRSPHRLPEST